MHADKEPEPLNLEVPVTGCQFPQSQCHPSPRTGIALGTRLPLLLKNSRDPRQEEGGGGGGGGRYEYYTINRGGGATNIIPLILAQ